MEELRINRMLLKEQLHALHNSNIDQESMDGLDKILNTLLNAEGGPFFLTFTDEDEPRKSKPKRRS